MARTGEIITFQVGNYANFVGAHYFNLQDPTLHPEYENEFNWRAMWREGQNLQRQRVLTPRVLIFDLKDKWSNKFVRKSGDLADPKALASTSQSTLQTGLDRIEKGISWDGSVQRVILSDGDSDSDSESGPSSVKRKANLKKGGDNNQDNYCQWGEYAKWRLHSTDKFAFRIPNFMYNAESGELVSYGQGLDVYGRMEESFVDGIRLYAEDCDCLEGFQMLVDEYDGFTGICGGIMEHLGDEYDKKACLGLGLNRPLPEPSVGSQGPTLKDYKIRISNTVQLWTSLARHARVFSSFGVCEDIFTLNPVSRKFTGVIQDCNLPFISSSILAATLDSLTAPYRLANPTFPLHEMTSLLNAFGHKMTMINSAYPFPLKHQTLFKTLDKEGLSWLTNLTPNIQLNLEKSLGNLFVIRGVKQDQVISKSDAREYKYADIKSVTSCLELYCQESFPRSVHVIKDIVTPIKSMRPMPKLYDSSFLDTFSFQRGSSLLQGDYWQLPALASAHNTPAVGDLIEKIVSITGGGVGGSSMKMKSFYEASSETCNSSTVDYEDYSECVNELSNLRDAYLRE